MHTHTHTHTHIQNENECWDYKHTNFKLICFLIPLIYPSYAIPRNPRMFSRRQCPRRSDWKPETYLFWCMTTPPPGDPVIRRACSVCQVTWHDTLSASLMWHNSEWAAETGLCIFDTVNHSFIYFDIFHSSSYCLVANVLTYILYYG